MKKIVLSILAIFLSTGISIAQSTQGGGLSTKAILALEGCFDEFQNFTCGGGGGTVGGSGTTNFLPIWTAASTLGDSIAEYDGTNFDINLAASNIFRVLDASGDRVLSVSPQSQAFIDLDADGTLNNVFSFNRSNAGSSQNLLTVQVNSMGAANGSDTIRGIFVNLTHASHTGTNNNVYGTSVDGIIASANANESGYHLGTGWDNFLQVDSSSFSAFHTQTTLTANRTFTWPNLTGDVSILSGLTDDFLVRYNSTTGQLENSRIQDGGLVGIDMHMRVSNTQFGGVTVGAANSITISAVGGGTIQFEGSVDDTTEGFLDDANLTGTDKTRSLPNFSGTLLVAASGTATQNSLPRYGGTLGQTSDSAINDTGSIIGMNRTTINFGGTDVVGGANTVAFSTTLGGSFVFEGDASDANEGTLRVAAGLTGDRTWTLPDATGTVAVVTSTQNFLTRHGAVEGVLADSAVEDTGTVIGMNRGTVNLGGSSTLGGANTVQYSSASGGQLIFEGATADDFETFFVVTDPTADRTITIPNSSGTLGVVQSGQVIVPSTLATNAVDAANSIWGVSNGLRLEGATADAFETTLTPIDPTATRTISIPNASGVMALVQSGEVAIPSTLITNAVDAANSIWGESNNLAFEGATADAFEGRITIVDVTADRTYTLPDVSGTFAFVGAGQVAIPSTLTTNAVDAANSIWGVSNALRFEGATADGFETSLTVVDPTAARTITLPNASGTVVLQSGSFVDFTVQGAALGNPSSGQVREYYRQDIDQGAGTASADCAKVARRSTGVEVVLAIIVIDGTC